MLAGFGLLPTGEADLADDLVDVGAQHEHRSTITGCHGLDLLEGPGPVIGSRPPRAETWSGESACPSWASTVKSSANALQR
jgi:hypothetical protein